MSLSKLWEDMYFGNGKPGITTRMALVESSIGSINTKLNWVLVTFVGAIVTVGVDIIVRLAVK